MGTARILATSMEYANATKVDNRRASQIRHRLLPASPAHQKVVSRKGLTISRVIVKATSPIPVSKRDRSGRTNETRS